MDEKNNIQEESLTQDNNINSVEPQSFSNEHVLEAEADNSSNVEADLNGNKTNQEATINSSNTDAKENYFDGNYISNQQAAFNTNNATNSDIERRNATNPQAYSARGNQVQNFQVSTLERQMLLNYNNPLNITSLSNWTKVMLTALVVLIPGMGQIVGLIFGLVFIANDRDADRRSYGAALITVSVIAFIISAIFWFMFALSFGPELYYY